MHAEHLNNQPNQLAELQAGRMLLAERASERRLRGCFQDYSLNPATTLNRVTNNGFNYDAGATKPRDLMAFEAVGIEPSAIINSLRGEQSTNSSIAEMTLGTDHLTVSRYGEEGFTVKLENLETGSAAPKKSDLLETKVTERFASSPAYVAVKKAGEALRADERTPYEFNTEPFDMHEDPLGSLTFLDEIGMARLTWSFQRELLAGKSMDEVLTGVLSGQNLAHGVEKISLPAQDMYQWGKQLIKRLTVDHETGLATFSAVRIGSADYMETANQSQAEAVPFVETECAAELTRVLDAAGLMFHPNVQTEMMNVDEADRYGSVYTQLSREIAKWVNNPERAKLSNLFVPYDENYAASALTEKMLQYRSKETTDMMVEDARGDEPEDIAAGREAAVREAVAGIDISQMRGEAAPLLLSLAQQVVTRENDKVDGSDLEVTKERVSLRDGGCFDVAAYYIGGAGRQGNMSGKLQQVQIGGKNFLEKTHGKHTFLSTEPIHFNGVDLPQGSLFSRQSDGGWAFLRLTPFAFNEAEDQLATGSELAKAYENEVQALLKLGGATIDHLVQAAL